MSNKKGLLALSPLLILIVMIVMFTIYSIDKTDNEPNISLAVAFLAASVFAVATSTGDPINKRIENYSKGAGSSNLMLMLWVYVLAGAFAASAKGMGSIDATVNIAVNYLPSSMLLPGLFIASCFISLSIGTSVGTIVALVPIAAGIASSTDFNVALTTAVIVGGAYFGDNLSFISDTTVVATKTQDCLMSDKFKVNFLIVAPAAIILIVVYFILGTDIQAPKIAKEVDFVKVIPYLIVLITAIAGLNVLLVLTIGIVLCGFIGIVTNEYNFPSLLGSIGEGILGMGELVIIAMMAGGMLEMIRKNGGIDFIIDKLTNHVHNKRGAELSIAALVSFVNICTANNTVAILTVGGITKRISEKYGVDKRKAASILDTFSCTTQGLLPYGIQMLLAAGLAAVNPIEILQYLYYPMAIGASALFAILLRFPKKYS